MTQPDQYFPDTAVNALSFADYAMTPQEDWEAAQRGAEIARWSPLAILGQIPIIGDLAEIITGIEDGDLNDLGTFGLRIRRVIQALLFGAGSPIGGITEQQPNLLPDGVFVTGTIKGGPDWTVDPTFTRTTGDGSAKLVCDGLNHALRSGETPTDTIPVSAGQNIRARIYVALDNYLGVGDPAIRLQLVPFTADGQLAPVTLTTFAPNLADLAWPGQELTGTWTVPEGVVGVQLRVHVTDGALSGVVWFDDAYLGLVGKLQKTWVDGLPEELQFLGTFVQSVIDTIFNALTGSTSILTTLGDLVNALNVGVVGAINAVVGTIFRILNALTGGLVGSPGQGATESDVFNIANIISGRASQGALAWEVLGYRNNTSADNGLLPSSEANYNITVVNTSLTATQAASLIGVIRVQRSAPLGVVSWLGCGTSLTAFYVNIWKIDATTGNWALAHHSPDIKADLVPGSTPGWNFYNLAAPLARVQGEDYAYELVPVGGTHTVRGFTPEDNIPDHPHANVVNLAATRDNTTNPNTPPTTIAKASVVRSQNVPWIEAAIDTGNQSDQKDPITVYVTQPTTVPIPRWAAYADVVVLGSGGAGSGGIIGLFGNPGKAGKFNATTWVRGTHFSGNTTVVEYTASKLAIPGYEIVADNGTNGVGVGGVGPTGHPIGPGPGTFQYKGVVAAGGENQTSFGGAGLPPGGAGNGGHWMGLFTAGGAGSAGAAWVQFRQNPLEGETAGPGTGDITPPTPPTTVDFVSATNSTLTVTWSGATD